MTTDRRSFLRAASMASAAAGLLPTTVARAMAIPARHRTGTIMDVEHVVIFMQENRSFDHYFGTMAGVRGFGDRFPIPVKDALGNTGKTVWYQVNDADPANPRVIAPFRLNTVQTFDYMRVSGTPHAWLDAQPDLEAALFGKPA